MSKTLSNAKSGFFLFVKQGCFVIHTNKCTVYIYIYISMSPIYFITSALLHVSMHPHRLKGAFSLYFDEVIKIIRVTNSIKSLFQIFAVF
jgi:hypothetical protein